MEEVIYKCPKGCCVQYAGGQGYGGSHPEIIQTTGTACFEDHGKWRLSIGFNYCPVCGQHL